MVDRTVSGLCPCTMDCSRVINFFYHIPCLVLMWRALSGQYWNALVKGWNKPIKMAKSNPKIFKLVNSLL